MDWPELRLQLQLWLYQSWPFRVIAWLRLLSIREVPMDMPGTNPTTLAAMKAAKSGKVTNVTLDDDL